MYKPIEVLISLFIKIMTIILRMHNALFCNPNQFYSKNKNIFTHFFLVSIIRTLFLRFEITLFVAYDLQDLNQILTRNGTK